MNLNNALRHTIPLPAEPRSQGFMILSLLPYCDFALVSRSVKLLVVSVFRLGDGLRLVSARMLYPATTTHRLAPVPDSPWTEIGSLLASSHVAGDIPLLSALACEPSEDR